MKLGIVIPAFNEAGTITKTVESVAKFGTAIVTDDCSNDDTAHLAESAGAVVVRHATNRGYDQALNSGFNRARELGLTHVITFDADGQHPSAMIPEYIKKFEQGYGLVVGIRPEQQRFAETVFSMYTKIVYGIQDPLCGMKGYELLFFKEIALFDSLGLCGTELMFRYLKMGVKVAQLPIPIRDRVDQSRMGRALKANFSILNSLFKSIVYLH